MSKKVDKERVYIELSNAENSVFHSTTADEYSCSRCEYIGKLTDNMPIGDSVGAIMGLGFPVSIIVFLSNNGVITALWEGGAIFLGWVVALMFCDTGIPSYWAKCPNCQIKSKPRLIPINLNKDKYFEKIIGN